MPDDPKKPEPEPVACKICGKIGCILLHEGRKPGITPEVGSQMLDWNIKHGGKVPR